MGQENGRERGREGGGGRRGFIFLSCLMPSSHKLYLPHVLPTVGREQDCG
jgi:hypothetical protein